MVSGHPEDSWFERDWPRLRDHLYALLAKRGCPASLTDDIVQETGARLWERRALIDRTRPVEALANTVATNLLRDHLRKQKAIAADASLPAMQQCDSVEREVLARDEVRRVASALDKLSFVHREALVDAVEGDSGRAPASVRMMRMRARHKLRLLLDDMRDYRDGCLAAVRRVAQTMRSRAGEMTVGEQAARAADMLVALVGVALVVAPQGPAVIAKPYADDARPRLGVANERPFPVAVGTPPHSGNLSTARTTVASATKDIHGSTRLPARAPAVRPLVRVAPVGAVSADSRGATFEPALGNGRPVKIGRDSPLRQKVCRVDRRLSAVCGTTRR